MEPQISRPISTAEDIEAIRQGVRAVMARFDDEYWLARDEDGVFPHAFHKAMAKAGWLGITMPEEYGGAGLGVMEAAVMMHEVASHGGGMTATSSVHINLFGPHPIVVHGTPEQKAAWIPRLVSGEDQVCFGITEPDAGLNTTRIKTFAEKVPGGYVVHGQKVWTSTAQVANKIMLLTRTTRFEDAKRPTDGITISTPISTGRRSKSGGSRRWAARRWIRMRSSSTACSFRTNIASGKRARVSPTSSTA